MAERKAITCFQVRLYSDSLLNCDQVAVLSEGEFIDRHSKEVSLFYGVFSFLARN